MTTTERQRIIDNGITRRVRERTDWGYHLSLLDAYVTGVFDALAWMDEHDTMHEVFAVLMEARGITV